MSAPQRWSEVDLEISELRLRDTKTGPRTILLSPEAAAVPQVAVGERSRMELPRFGGHLQPVLRDVQMPKTHLPYAPEYRLQRVERISDVKRHTIHAFIQRAVKDEAEAIYTDELKSYLGDSRSSSDPSGSVAREGLKNLRPLMGGRG